jgi:hypothetical protein
MRAPPPTAPLTTALRTPTMSAPKAPTLSAQAVRDAAVAFVQTARADAVTALCGPSGTSGTSGRQGLIDALLALNDTAIQSSFTSPLRLGEACLFGGNLFPNQHYARNVRLQRRDLLPGWQEAAQKQPFAELQPNGQMAWRSKGADVVLKAALGKATMHRATEVIEARLLLVARDLLTQTPLSYQTAAAALHPIRQMWGMDDEDRRHIDRLLATLQAGPLAPSEAHKAALFLVGLQHRGDTEVFMMPASSMSALRSGNRRQIVLEFEVDFSAPNPGIYIGVEAPYVEAAFVSIDALFDALKGLRVADVLPGAGQPDLPAHWHRRATDAGRR